MVKGIKKTQQRSCVVCRKTADKKNLLRLVCDEDGNIELDGGLNKEGRGAYIHSELPCVMKAGNGKIWQHVFKRQLNKEKISLVISEIKKLLIK